MGVDRHQLLLAADRTLRQIDAALAPWSTVLDRVFPPDQCAPPGMERPSYNQPCCPPRECPDCSRRLVDTRMLAAGAVTTDDVAASADEASAHWAARSRYVSETCRWIAAQQYSPAEPVQRCMIDSFDL